jgi:hypothetical protein
VKYFISFIYRYLQLSGNGFFIAAHRLRNRKGYGRRPFRSGHRRPGRIPAKGHCREGMIRGVDFTKRMTILIEVLQY